jgi:hypothetical protein
MERKTGDEKIKEMLAYFAMGGEAAKVVEEALPKKKYVFEVGWAILIGLVATFPLIPEWWKFGAVFVLSALLISLLLDWGPGKWIRQPKDLLVKYENWMISKSYEKLSQEEKDRVWQKLESLFGAKET